MYRSHSFTLIITLLLFFSLPVVLVASDNKSWRPTAIKYDWLQLTSLEWLKGNVKSMYNKKVEFDSDKLKLLSIKWEDVRYLQTHELCYIKIEKVGLLTGLLTISGKKIIIKNGEHTKEFPRDKVISFTPAGDTELDLWAIKFTMGLNLRSGNTEQIDYTAKLSTKRRTAESRLAVDYTGNISKTNAVSGSLEETINNHRLSTALDIYVTRYFFYNPINVEYFRDPFQNIDQRMTVGVGLGYMLRDTGKLEWNLSAGPAFLTTKYISVTAGDDIRVDSGSFAISTDIDLEINSKLDFIYKYDVQISKKKSGGYSHFMIATIESELVGDLDLDFSLIWNRISYPTVNDKGIVPEPNDFQFVFGVSYEF